MSALVLDHHHKLHRDIPMHHATSDGDDDGGEIPFADGSSEDGVGVNTEGQGENQIVYRHYAHDGHFWHVPSDFSFSTGVRLDMGWKKMWICGLCIRKKPMARRSFPTYGILCLHVLVLVV